MPGKRKWTTDKIIESIKEAYEKKGSPVYDKWMNNNGYSIPLSRIKKDGKSLALFAEENGIGHLVQVLYNTKGYSEEYIVEEFKRLYSSKGVKLCDTYLIENNMNKLTSYIRKHYGGLNYFIEKHNLQDIFEVRYAILSEGDVIKKVKSFSKQLNRKICMHDLQDNLSGCAHYIYRNYGNFEDFCEANNLLDLFQYKGGITWSNDLAKEEIITQYNLSGNKISLSALKALKLHGLIHYIRRNFDGVSDFVNKLDLHDYMYVSNFSSSCSYGEEFESLVKQTFDVLGYKYEYQSREFDGIRPDFYFKDTDTIVDSKLSSHTAFNLTNGFFEKYTNQCSKLILVYLKGAPIQKKEGKVEFKCISDFYELLISKGQRDLVDDFENLKIKAESIELHLKESM